MIEVHGPVAVRGMGSRGRELRVPSRVRRWEDGRKLCLRIDLVGFGHGGDSLYKVNVLCLRGNAGCFTRSSNTMDTS
jgi:hypothetical protein